MIQVFRQFSYCIYFVSIFLKNVWYLTIYHNYSELCATCREFKMTSMYSATSKATATSKMELNVAGVINCWQSWTIVTICSILDTEAGTDPPKDL